MGSANDILRRDTPLTIPKQIALELDEGRMPDLPRRGLKAGSVSIWTHILLRAGFWASLVVCVACSTIDFDVHHVACIMPERPALRKIIRSPSLEIMRFGMK